MSRLVKQYLCSCGDILDLGVIACCCTDWDSASGHVELVGRSGQRPGGRLSQQDAAGHGPHRCFPGQSIALLLVNRNEASAEPLLLGIWLLEQTGTCMV